MVVPPRTLPELRGANRDPLFPCRVAHRVVICRLLVGLRTSVRLVGSRLLHFSVRASGCHFHRFRAFYHSRRDYNWWNGVWLRLLLFVPSASRGNLAIWCHASKSAGNGRGCRDHLLHRARGEVGFWPTTRLAADGHPD